MDIQHILTRGTVAHTASHQGRISKKRHFLHLCRCFCPSKGGSEKAIWMLKCAFNTILYHIKDVGMGSFTASHQGQKGPKNDHFLAFFRFEHQYVHGWSYI